MTPPSFPFYGRGGTLAHRLTPQTILSIQTKKVLSNAARLENKAARRRTKSSGAPLPYPAKSFFLCVLWSFLGVRIDLV